MYDLTIFAPLEVVYDENAGVETLYLEATSDKCDTLGIPRDRVDGARLEVSKKPHDMLYAKSVKYSVQYWDGDILAHDSRTLIAESDYDTNELDLLWERYYEKLVPGYKQAILELLDSHMKDGLDMKSFMREIECRMDNNGTPYDPAYAKYGTQALEGARVIIGLADPKRLGLEVLRLRALVLAESNLENLDLPEVRSDVYLSRYDEGYNDALVDLLDAFGIEHGLGSFDD